MKALYFEEHGELDVIQYGDVPDPEIGPGEILIRVGACAINHLDIWVRRGWPGLNLTMPHWCGADVSGEIADMGKDVKNFAVGQRVVVDPGVSIKEDAFTRRGEVSLSPGYQVLGEQIRGGAAEYLVCAYYRDDRAGSVRFSTRGCRVVQGTQLTIYNLIENAGYSWAVTARNDYAWGTRSASWLFTTGSSGAQTLPDLSSHHLPDPQNHHLGSNPAVLRTSL